MPRVKVVHVITRFILGGAQENTLLTCEGLGRMPDYEVFLLTGPALGPEGELLERAKAGPFKTIIIPSLRRDINPPDDTRAYFELARQIRRIAPEIVHTHSSKAGILGRFAAARTRVPAIVHTIHGLPFDEYQSRLRNRLYVFLETRAAAVSGKIISVCDAMSQQAVDAGVARPDKFLTVYSGMETETFLDSDSLRAATRAELGFSDGDVVIGKVARLFHMKGHDDVLRAAPAIIEKCPRARFMFVGDGILREELARKAAGMGIADRLTFTGLVDPSRIPAMISAMDILVHASMREGLARTVVQGLLCGKPVVTYDIGGAREVVIPGRTGWLLKPGDVDGLAGATAEAASNPGTSGRMGAAGRELCRERFSARKMVEDIHSCYRKLLAKPR
ncbi:MAG TPA: glycosyltransferase family 4 protein [Candidatus Brocadiia bacterium]|nr:glycosyltransferase family 4 protein [Candidatus Brocadiia bacterium]